MPFGVWTPAGTNNHVLDEGPDHHMRRGNFDRKKLSAWEMAGWNEQNRQFFNNSIRALDKHWPKCISVAADYVESDKYDVYILWLTMSGYELSERPS